MVESSGKKWLLVGLIAAVVVVAQAAVACDGGTSDVSAGPEETVRSMLSAVEAMDVDAYFALMDPQGLTEMEEQGFTLEAAKSMYEGNLTFDSIKFEGIRLATELSEDGQSAVVTIVEGVATMVEGGEEIIDDVNDSDEPTVVYLVLREGKWYLDVSMMM